MPEDAYTAALQPSHLLDLAIRGHWVAVCLAIVGLILVVAVTTWPGRLSKVASLTPLAWSMPVYVWAIVGSWSAVWTFESLAVSHGMTTFDLWAAALSQWLALFAVIVPAGLSAVLAGQRIDGKGRSSMGLVAVVGAVTADWVFLILVATPIR